MLKLLSISTKDNVQELRVKAIVREAVQYSESIEGAKNRIENDIARFKRLNTSIASNVYTVEISDKILTVYHSNSKGKKRLVAQICDLTIQQ